MYEDKREWLNQNILTFKDQTYNSNSTLYLNVSSFISPEESFSISPPSLEFSIRQNSENLNRRCKLSCYEVTDLLLSLNGAYKQFKENSKDSITVTKTYSQKEYLEISTSRASDNSQIASISISKGVSDLVRIVIPITVLFPLISEKLKSFSMNYDRYINMMNQIYTNTLLYRNLQINNEINKAIKVIPASIIDLTQTNNQETSSYDSLQHNFDSSVDLDNTEVKELSKIESDLGNKQSTTTNSNITMKFGNNIEELESYMNSIMLSNQPITEFGSTYNMELPDISDNELKSTLYFSKLFFGYTFKNYIDNQNPIPVSSPVIKYKSPENLIPEVLDSAYDLLTIIGYVKLVRGKLESFESDSMKNKSVFYLALRSFADLYTFSFIKNSSKDVIVSNVKSRFNQYLEKGYFKPYQAMLNMYKCSQVTEMDLVGFVSEVVSKALSDNCLDISNSHEQAYKSGMLKLPFINDLTIEQIINELVPIEIKLKLGGDIEESTTLSKEVEKYINSKGPVKETKKREPKQETHLERYINNNLESVPASYKDWIIKISKQMRSKTFDPTWVPNIDDLIDFPDGIILALYYWDPEKNELYSSWVNKISESTMSKNSVLTVWRYTTEKPEDKNTIVKVSDDWADVV